MKKGIVMEGGAMRGLFTCGVLDVLMENGVTFDGAIGVSAGATFGCNLKSGQIGRAYRYNKKYCSDPRYHSIRSLITTGDIYNVPFCYDELPYKLDKWDIEAFEKSPMEFYCVATDIETGKPVYHKCETGKKEDIVWIQASDSIPLKFMEDQGYDDILVIETQPIDYVKEPQKYMPLVRFSLRKYPNMIKCMQERYLMYNQEKKYIRHQEELGMVRVIRPKEPLNISAVEKDPNEITRVYELGRAAGSEYLSR